MRNDITTREDVEKLVSTFYDRVKQDELLEIFFRHIDFEKHMPRMIHFWAFVLLDEAGYTTDVTAVHRFMKLEEKHFTRWLHLFHATVDDLFEGDKANQAKERATLVGWTIKSKMID